MRKRAARFTSGISNYAFRKLGFEEDMRDPWTQCTERSCIVRRERIGVSEDSRKERLNQKGGEKRASEEKRA